LNGIDHCLLRALGLEPALLATTDLSVQPVSFVQTLAEKALATVVVRASTGESGINLQSLQRILFN
jgi:hypothetical protein